MTAAYRLRGLGWFLSSVVIALACYLVSLQVAAERKRADDVEASILQARRDIRALETEFATRTNMAQLEKWNGEVFALAAPRADQFVGSETALALVDFNGEPAARVAAIVPAARIETAVAEKPLPVPPAGVRLAETGKPFDAAPRAILARADDPIRRAAHARKLAMLDHARLGARLSENPLGEIVRSIPLDGGGAR